MKFDKEPTIIETIGMCIVLFILYTINNIIPGIIPGLINIMVWLFFIIIIFWINIYANIYNKKILICLTILDILFILNTAPPIAVKWNWVKNVSFVFVFYYISSCFLYELLLEIWDRRYKKVEK